jgi:hypothetical protein
MWEKMSAVQLSPLVAACTAYGTSVLFFAALRMRARVRVVVFVLLAVLVALTPWMIPAEARIARFIVAVYSCVLVLKMWDLHLGAGRSVRPRLSEFLGFLANLASLVHRRTGSERQPTPRKNGIKLFKSLVEVSLALLAFNILLRLDWGSTPFLVEHVLKASAFFVGATALFSAFAAVARALGGYAPEPMTRPLLARTPADFWRRYNRWTGEWLREDLFRPIGGRRHPVPATLAVFAVSGLLHEYVFSVAVGRVQGFQLAFFLMQGAAVVLTARVKPGRIIGVGTTFAFNALTSIMFFASVHGIAPFYEGGLPAWLWGA